MVPVNIQQMIESVKDKKTPEHVKFNQAQVLEAVAEYSRQAVDNWKKNSK